MRSTSAGCVPRTLPLPLILSTLLLTTADPTAFAQGWERVVQLNDLPGSAIGGGVGNTLYAALNRGDVFRSDDNGRTWIAITNGLVDDAGRLLLPKAFVVTPTGRVLRGGDNASWANKVGSPIFRSDNQGARWTEVPLPFATAPRNPAGIGVSDLVVHQGALYFSDVLSEGVWKSTDDGLTWTAVGGQLPTAPFVNFAKTYYALASAGESLLTVQASRGVFRSTDGGQSWSQAVNGIPGVPDSPLVGGRTWSGSDVTGLPDGTAFTVSDGRLYRSRDGGASWTEVGAGILQGPNPFVPSVMQPIARKVEVLGDRVYVSSTDGNPRFFEGPALGESWVELPQVPDNNGNASLLAQSFHAHQGALYFAGSRGIHRLDLETASRRAIAPLVSVTPTGPYVANVGQRLRATARASGTAPFTYEWRLNGTPLPGQTSAALDWPAEAPLAGGSLSLVVRNAGGAITNDLGSVAVAPVAPFAPDYSFRPQSSAFPVATFALGPDGSVFYGGSVASLFGSNPTARRALPDGTVDPAFNPETIQGGPSLLFPLGDGSVLAGAAGTADNARYYRRLLADGSVDAQWPWPAQVAGGPRRIRRLPDGKFLIAGGSLGGLHRLLADGSFDSTFRGPETIGTFQRNYVRDFVLLPDGKILIAGQFAIVDGFPRSGLARLLPGGAVDAGWVPAALPNGSEINALALLPDGKILIGGNFATVGGQSRRHLARLNANGTLDPSLPELIPISSPPGVVQALAAQPDGKVWVGGDFWNVSGRNNLFRLTLDGTVDTSVPDLGLSGDRTSVVPTSVTALAFTPEGRLWIGSAALSLGGFTAGQLFRVFTDVQGPAQAYAGLDQTPAPGATVTWNATVHGTYTGLQWRFHGVPLQGATSPTLSLANVSAAANGLYDLVVTSPGGSSTSAPVRLRVRGPVEIDLPPQPTVGVVSNQATFAVTAFGRLPLTYQWLHHGTPLASATNRLLTLTNLTYAASGDYSVRVASGDGSSVTSPPAFLAVIPPPGSAQEGFNPELFAATSPTVIRDLEFLPDGRLLVGGVFSATTNGGPEALLVRLNPDGSRDPGFQFATAGISEFVALDRRSDGSLAVLVRLTSGGGPYAVRRLLPGGAIDPTFAESTVTFGNDLQFDDQGRVLVVSSDGLRRLGTNGVPDAAFNQAARLNGPAQSISLDPAGRIYVTGTFTTVGGQPRAQLARILPDGRLDTTFTPTNVFSSQWTVRALADGAVVGDLNGFRRLGELGRPDPEYRWSGRLQVWDLNPAGDLAGILPGIGGDGVLRAPDGGPASPVATMKVPASFISYSLLRWAPDGALWVALGANGTVPPNALLHRLHGGLTPLGWVTHPVSQLVEAGRSVTLRVAATGTSSIGYQWRRAGVDLPGQTGLTLTLSNFTAALAGDYSVVAANQSGSLTSRVATLTLFTAPEITAEPESVVVSARQAAQFTVAARGPQLRYQWRAGNTNLPGATNASLTIANAGPAQVGWYSVRITNQVGAVESRAARLRLRPTSQLGAGGGPTDGLVRRWRFENSLQEEISGLPTVPNGNPTFAPGIEGGSAVSLRSGQNWVQLGNATGAAGRLTDEQFTVSFWIRPETAGTLNPYSFILLTPNPTPGTFTAREHLLWLAGTDNQFGANRLLLTTRGFNAVVSTNHRAHVTNLVGRWTHFAIVYRGTAPNNPDNFSVYLDGQKLALGGGALAGGSPNLQNALGRYTPAANFQVDDLRVYNRPLNDADVTALVTPPVVDPAPVITAHPVGGTVAAGGSIALTVGAEGSNLFYEWFRGNKLLADFDGPTLALSGVTTNDAGDYRVVVSNGGGSTNSLPSTLSVTAAVDPLSAWASAAGLAGGDALPGADPDLDGANNLAEFYYGTSPANRDSRPSFAVAPLDVNGAVHPALVLVRRRDPGPARLTVAVSSSIGFTDELGSIVASTTPLENGLERVVIRSNTPDTAHPSQFFRLTVE